MKILIINGPNLNLLGKREPGIYGSSTFEDYLEKLREAYPDVVINYFQSNLEGGIVDTLHEAGYPGTIQPEREGEERPDGIILNAGAYTHTSVAIHDAIKAIPVPVIEVHISNVHQREDFRHHSFISPAAAGIIIGFGLESYRLAIDSFINRLK
ncbi:MAG: type II 3-dehydroquinate dehydratase [Bacteroidales bacterium]|nr:type II 3-dehydroquinate dehydratase [Bacteroidales bacterium]